MEKKEIMKHFKFKYIFENYSVLFKNIDNI